ncbi:hypothetical protein M378DRAFT_75551 [Amanita muscaria Koide BX008]|uniref:Uncharacterized protein n=1 Tax=Amanita muscaria (strain Koide BX008) TaxID=946122 RepID=A0A0C2SSD7_AMAMK|nr:hypothetical protein M378DRAFT_75551 [Amanita muscaria Koide BX008]
MRCPSENTARIDQSSFWTPGAWHWDAHRIGWTVAGVFTLLTMLVSGLSILAHCRNYTVPRQQRQIIRILFMPPIYAFISFLSYRFFREYVYFSLVQSGVLSAISNTWVLYIVDHFLQFTKCVYLFLCRRLLLIEYVAESAETHDRSSLLAEKEKRRLIIPEYFMHAVKWSVLQYAFVRPTITLIAIICEVAGVLCESQGYSAHFASVYLDTIDFISISVALYGLILFYNLTKEDLRGRRPLAKFFAIKLLVFFTFYQSFLFDALKGRAIHATAYWTETNIANGLSALTICIEMLLFSAFMWWAYPVGEYRREGTPTTTIGTPLLDWYVFTSKSERSLLRCPFSFNYCKMSSRICDHV